MNNENNLIEKIINESGVGYKPINRIILTWYTPTVILSGKIMRILNCTVDAATFAVRSSTQFIAQHKLFFCLGMLGLMAAGVAAANSGYSLFHFYIDENTFVYLNDPKLGELAYRIYDPHARDRGFSRAFSYQLSDLNRELSCGFNFIPANLITARDGFRPTNAQLVECLNKGLSLFTSSVNGAAHALIEKIDLQEFLDKKSEAFPSHSL